MMHLLVRGKLRAGGGFYAIAEYRQIEPPPNEMLVRERESWEAWVRDNLGKFKPWWLIDKEAER